MTSRRRWRSIPLSTVRPTTLAVHERRPQWFEDLEAWPATHPGQHPELVENMRRLGMPGGVALPLIVAGSVVGVVGIGFTAPRRLTSVERSTLLALAEQGAQALDRARLYRAEQRIAETLQRSLLPQGLPPPGPARPRRPLPARRCRHPGRGRLVRRGRRSTTAGVAIAVGDVVGQGPSAAAVMGQLRSALSTALLAGKGPAEALELLDRSPPGCPAPRPPPPPAWSWTGARDHPLGPGRAPAAAAARRRARCGSSTRAGSGTVLGVADRAPFTEGTAPIEPGAVAAAVHRRPRRAARTSRSTPAWTGWPTRSAGTAREPPDGPGHACCCRDPRRQRPARRRRAHRRPAPARRRCSDGCPPTRPGWPASAAPSWPGRPTAALPEDTVEDLQLTLGEALANAVEHAYRRRAGRWRARTRWPLVRTARSTCGSRASAAGARCRPTPGSAAAD